MIRALAVFFENSRWHCFLMGLVLAAMVWPFATPVAYAGKDFPLTLGGPFSLLDHQGRERTDKDFRGRFLLVYFGYTNCPNICLSGLRALSEALVLLGEEADRVQPLFLTVDPARDKPKNLKRFIKLFHPRLVGLTGSESQVREVASAYRVYRAKVILPDAPKEDYLVTHTPNTYLMGPDGTFVALFPHDTEPEVLARALRRYLSKATAP